LLLGLNKMD